MKKIILTILVLAFAFVFAEAKTVSITDFGAVANDANNDRAAVQSAVDDLKSNGGGTIIFPSGEIIIDGTINLVQSGNYLSFRFQGDLGSVIKIAGGEAAYTFNVGNVNQLVFENLIVIGNLQSANYDVLYFLTGSYTDSLIVVNCRFLGIQAKHSLFYLGSIDAKFINSDFGGNGTDNANIYADDSIRSITVDTCRFIDYGRYKNDLYSNASSLHWIHIEKTTFDSNVFFTSQLTVRNSRMDEGVTVAIKAKKVSHVFIENLSMNVSSRENSAGILLDNVKNATIISSNFGYTPLARYAVKLINTKVRMRNIILTEGVLLASRDRTSRVWR